MKVGMRAAFIATENNARDLAGCERVERSGCSRDFAIPDAQFLAQQVSPMHTFLTFATSLTACRPGRVSEWRGQKGSLCR